MPATSIDTFFACSLMVLVVVAAMAGASKLLYPHIDNAGDESNPERLREISRHLLLSCGTPSDWGEQRDVLPASFGLAKTGSTNPYELNIDKVSRLNRENRFSIEYSELYQILDMPDLSFKVEIKPLFEVAINLTAAFETFNGTTYRFEVSTMKSGSLIETELRCFTVSEDHAQTSYALAPTGRADVNVTLSNASVGPALLAVLARSIHDARVTSFSYYPFSHGSSEPKPRGTFLSLSPLNYTLYASKNYPATNLSQGYALSFRYNSTLSEVANSNDSITYAVPRFLDSSPTLIVLTGHNSTDFFLEWTAYPSVPLQIGADFTDTRNLVSALAFTYTVRIELAIYECTIWLGGPRQ